ncbi:hypothetical protein ACQ4PT_004619 [Festuca glaucescens]
MEEATTCTAGNAVGVSLDERFAIMRSIGLESIDEDDVMRLLGKKVAPVCYVWCDPSPSVQIAQLCFNKVFMDEPCFALERRKILYQDNYPNTKDSFGSAMKDISVTPVIKTVLLIFQADIWLLSMDHEEDLHDKLIRQYCKGMKRENKPIILSHNKLPNLIEHPEFAKNGDPTWAIFMEDRDVTVSYKLRRAFCPAKVAKGNPCLEYIKYILFPWFGYFEVLRKEENGGSRTFQNMEELITDYESGALDAAEVKQALTEALSLPLDNMFAILHKQNNGN